MKAVYFINAKNDWGHVSAKVWDILEAEGVLSEKSGIIFQGQDVMKYSDGSHEYYFVPTDMAICRDYERFLPEMNRYFADYDMSAMVTWHEGTHAPDNVLTVHSLGDVDSGIYGRAKPRFMRNLMMAFENYFDE